MLSTLFHRPTFSILTLSVALVAFSALSGCGTNQQTSVEAAKDQGKEDPNNPNKPKLGVPPIFVETQFKLGQWIEWTRSANNQVAECIRWTITGIQASGIVITAQSSTKCVEPDNYYVETILFNPNTGEINGHIITIGDSSSTQGPLKGKSIYPFLYGDETQVRYQLTTTKIQDEKYPSFHLLDSDRIYLNEPNTPFQGIAIQWREKKDNKIWKYELRQSE
ncbi:MAG: hypothetical protein COT73_08100, partial [Bdellovibrio sp. CG10_big_fil_rev_8_21_14_0_10_47_8]